MVFHHEPDGPHAPGSPRTAEDAYGRYKIACEDAVHAAHPGAMIVRIGWQIDPHQPGNNMLMELDRRQAQEGCIAASGLWRPACSFMEDTADAILGLLRNPRPGVVHLDSNAVEGHGFDAIVGALRRACARDSWVVQPTTDYRHDQRLTGHEGLLPPLSARLPLLRE
jgi:dTDP-4-dehydrorhamnose reductase